MAMKKEFAAGFHSEYLGSAVGKIVKTPVAVITLRLNPKDNYQPFTIMLDRPSIERLIEDLTCLLDNSAMLAKGKRQSLKLAEVEAIHLKLTD